MHAIVVGCGRVGRELAIRLDEEGHSVAVIDKNRDAFRKLPDRWSGRAVLGFGFDRDHLEQAEIGRAQAVAAVTSGDNTNILTARIAKETYEIPNVVARIYDPRRAVVYQRLGIPTVATVTWTTDQVLRRLFPERGTSEWSDSSGKIQVVERVLPDSWAGHQLGELSEGNQFRLTAVNRGGDSQLVKPDFVGQEGDVVYFTATTDAIPDLDARLAAGAEGAQ